MSSGTRVPFSKMLLRSLFVPIFLVGWAVVPMSEAGFQSNFNISNNGTGYFAFQDDGAVGDPARVTGIGLGASTGGVSGTTQSTQGNPLTADISISPLFNPTLVRSSGVVNGCNLPGAFDPAANGGTGSWNVGPLTVSLSGNLNLPHLFSAEVAGSRPQIPRLAPSIAWGGSARQRLWPRVVHFPLMVST